MRGKSDITGDVLTSRERHVDPIRFKPKAPRRPHFDETKGDERWKERVLFGATVLVSHAFFGITTCFHRRSRRLQAIVGFVVQTTVVRHKAIVQVTNGTRATSSRPKHPLADEALTEPTESVRSR